MNRFKHATAITAAGSATLLLAACGGEITPSDYDDNVPLRTVSTSAQENDGTANGTSAETTTAAGTGADGDTANSTEGNSGVVVNVTVNQETTNTNTATNNNTAANGCCGGCCGYHCCCDCEDDPNGQKPHICGDGNLDVSLGEECDYGRVCVGNSTTFAEAYEDDAVCSGCPAGTACVSEDGGAAACVALCTTNGICAGGEKCAMAEWELLNGDVCLEDCTRFEWRVPPYCGDGIVNASLGGLMETCDPGPTLCIPTAHNPAEYWAAPAGSGWAGLWGHTSADPCGCAVGQECVVRRVFPSACNPRDTYSCRQTCDPFAAVVGCSASDVCVTVNRLDPASTDAQRFCSFDCQYDTHSVCGSP